jgi:hypothetical protein
MTKPILPEWSICQMFVPGKPFQPCQLFQRKTRAYQWTIIQMINSRVDSWPYPQILDGTNRLAKDKISIAYSTYK